MEYRQLGASGIMVPVLSFGTATFGGSESFKAWGNTQTKEATRLVDICMEAGINMFDTADIYSEGLSEEVLGQSLAHRQRDKIILSTKSTFTFGEAPNNQGSSRIHMLKQVEGSLKRLQTDYIDIYHMHGFDGNTPVEETLRTLDDLVQSGKIRYIAASNFSGWHLMKSLAVSEKYGWNRYVAHQVYYSLTNREYEWELMPLGMDQKVGAIVWSPLAGGRLGGKFSRKKEWPETGRVAQGGSPVPETAVEKEHLFRITDALEAVAEETGKTVSQVAINWLLQRPTVANIIIGARNEEQLMQNLEAVGWKLSADQVKRLDEASEIPPVYPYWHQRQNLTLNPPPRFY
ncbi:aldo/keto reductase [Dyadobacter sediminis]|uniref:Aldo/keto reductase n=1 Tax=Dyadobacter sediminis TaxID=1493691 RepID=A0A5R9KKA9_9BACT|nr:aldo/keto reductase [Dyadobacter sediminis]TLU96635.1 aldo/keto reductase [Dyadobacter sediminis]GGB83921.1 oxidoreductase [Dyadobacter sediminis]